MNTSAANSPDTMEHHKQVSKDQKVFRFQGLSFKDELEGHKIDFKDNPIYLSLIPWEYCQYDCIYCHEGTRRKDRDELDLDLMLQLISEASSIGIRSLLLLGGEVLLRVKWDVVQQIVQAAFDHGLITVIYTNGGELDSEMANWLADRDVSLAFKVDSLDPQKYDSMTRRKGSFARTMQAIKIAKGTSIGSVVSENNTDRLVRLLFTTVGCSWNVEEYISLARFSTNNGARWMMESLNHRGSACSISDITIEDKEHSEAMRLAIALNPQQQHTFHVPCRLLSCITVRRGGEIATCPQDYCTMTDLSRCGTLKQAAKTIKLQIQKENWHESWTGICPIKQADRVYLSH